MKRAIVKLVCGCLLAGSLAAGSPSASIQEERVGNQVRPGCHGTLF